MFTYVCPRFRTANALNSSVLIMDKVCLLFRQCEETAEKEKMLRVRIFILGFKYIFFRNNSILDLAIQANNFLLLDHALENYKIPEEILFESFRKSLSSVRALFSFSGCGLMNSCEQDIRDKICLKAVEEER